MKNLNAEIQRLAEKYVADHVDDPLAYESGKYDFLAGAEAMAKIKDAKAAGLVEALREIRDPSDVNIKAPNEAISYMRHKAMEATAAYEAAESEGT